MEVVNMEYVNDFNINEAIVHVLDNNAGEPILNEYKLDLNEDTYKYLYKHIEKCLNENSLKYAKFKSEGNLVKETVNKYLKGERDNFIEMSKELSRQLFPLMKNNELIPSCDLVIVSIISDIGPIVGILKMDYVKNFTHKIDFFENKIGINLVQQKELLPGSSKVVQKAAFILMERDTNKFDLFVLDKFKKASQEDEYYSKYWTDSYLNCEYVTNERDNTKGIIEATEKFTRMYLADDAEKAENIRSNIRKKLAEDDEIEIEKLADELLKEVPGAKETYIAMALSKCDENFCIDKNYVDKKLKRVRLKIDKDIDLYIDAEAYKDKSKFVIKPNGDGSIDMIIKHVMNYIEK